MKTVKDNRHTRPKEVTQEFVATYVDQLRKHGTKGYELTILTMLRHLNVTVRGRQKEYRNSPMHCPLRARKNDGIFRNT